MMETDMSASSLFQNRFGICRLNKWIVLGWMVGAANVRAEEPVPQGLGGGDWASIQAAHEGWKHRFEADGGGGLVARNPGQGWQMEFDGRGFMARPDEGGWEWGLELRSAGKRARARLPEALEKRADVPAPFLVAANKFSIRHSAILEEWFVNDGRGLEQGWTFSERPEGVDGTLCLELAVRGALQAQGEGNAVVFADAAGATVLNYGGLKAWDATGRVLEARMRGEGERVIIEVDEAGARYPVTIDPLAQQAYLKASDTLANDWFGYSVAMSGDTVVVGAPYEASSAVGVNGDQADTSSPDAGAVYVFVRSGSTWSQQAYLKAGNTEAGDLFGYSVAMDGDTVVVGAYFEDSGTTGINSTPDELGAEAGAAYVFVRSGTSWSQQAYLKASNTDAGDWFGHSVAVSGNTVVVGAQNESSNTTGINNDQDDNSAFGAGAAYVFVRSGSNWNQQAYLKAANTGLSDAFGTSVAVFGDTVVVGAYGEDSNATGIDGNHDDNSANFAGAAYVFVRKGTGWSQQAYLKASNTEAGDYFGNKVAVSGDTVVVGAYLEDSNATGMNAPLTGGSGSQDDNSAPDSGAAYVFTRSGTSWSQQAYVKASNTDAGDWFGYSVALSADTLAVGSQHEASNATGINAPLSGGSGTQDDNSAASSGAAYVFVRKGTGWSQQAYLKAGNTGAGDEFGAALEVSGDRVLVGAYLEDSSTTGIDSASDELALNAGAAYLFHVGELLQSVARTTSSAPGAMDIAFGAAGVAVLNDAGASLFETALSGNGASKSRNRAVFSTLSGTGLDLLLQKGTMLSGFGGLPSSAKISSFVAPALNQTGRGIFQVTVSGKGISKSNNRLLVLDNGAFLSPVLRTGAALPEFGGAATSSFGEVAQHYTDDALALNYKLKANSSLGVSKTNDSGILFLDHDGVVLSFAAREGGSSFGGGGVFGQFPGQVALATGTQAFFLTPYTPTGEKARQAIFTCTVDGTTAFRYGPEVGDPATDLFNGETFRSFVAVNERDFIAVLRATLKGGPSSQNEGLWNCGSSLHLQKGVEFDTTNHPGLVVTKILKFWPVGTDQLVVQAQLGGTGVKGSNNQALLLRQLDADWQILLRTGDTAPGTTSRETISKLNMVEVDRVNGHYAVLGTLKGAASSANQALWMGQTGLGDDTVDADEPQRLPRLVVRKGEVYTTEQTPAGQIKGLALKPVADKTGAGARGQGLIVGADGSLLLTITGDRKVQELVRVVP